MQHTRRGQKKNPYKTMVRKIRTLARLRQRWENGININLQKKKAGGCGLKSFGSGSRTVVDLCEENNKTSGSIKCWTI